MFRSRRDASDKLLILLVVCAGQICHAQVGNPPAENPSADTVAVGQLLYVNVDGFGTPAQPIHEAYYRMVDDLDIGGVLPHFGSRDLDAMREAVRRLKASARHPLLVGIDFTKIDGPMVIEPGWIGLGFGAGLLGVYGNRLGTPCLLELFALQAFLHKALGLNQALGPTVDRSARYGFLDRDAMDILPLAQQLLDQLRRFHLLPTLKHYPYTPDKFSLHQKGRDEALSAAESAAKTAIFKALAPHVEVVMTTHVFNSRIDATAPVTFSPVWLRRLREDGFRGLIITDALLMMRDYGYLSTHEDMLRLPGVPEISRKDSIFAAKAILAGHHMVILEGTAADTRAVHRDLVKLLQHPSPLGREFSRRAAQATRTVADFKAKRASHLQEQPDVSPEVFQRAISLLNRLLASRDKVCRHQKAFEALSRYMPPLKPAK